VGGWGWDRDLAVLILVASWSWVVNATPRPLYRRERAPVPIVQEAGWTPGPVWTGLEKTNFLPPSWFEHRNVQALTSCYIAYAVPAGLEREYFESGEISDESIRFYLYSVVCGTLRVYGLWPSGRPASRASEWIVEVQ